MNEDNTPSGTHDLTNLERYLEQKQFRNEDERLAAALVIARSWNPLIIDDSILKKAERILREQRQAEAQQVQPEDLFCDADE